MILKNGNKKRRRSNSLHRAFLFSFFKIRAKRLFSQQKGILQQSLIVSVLLFSPESIWAFDFEVSNIADRISNESSSLQVVFWCFLGGLLSCLTPCVYPLIPITLGIFGARQEESKIKAFSLSFSFVLGIAVCFTALGLVAAASGTFFGSALSSPYVTISISIILILLALYTLDVFSLTGVHKLQQAANKLGGSGHQGAFLMGCASGVIAAPCVGPVLITILVIAASAASYFFSGLMLFSYALGLGLPFIILGTFSPLLSRIPQSGSWLGIVKYILATCIFAVAIFFAQGLIPKELLSKISSSSVLVFILILTAIFMLKASIKLKSSFLKALSSATASLLIISLVLNSGSGENLRTSKTSLSQQKELIWHADLKLAFEKSKQDNSIVMADLFAEWCAACKELDSLTFSQDPVQKELSKMTLAKIDFTSLSEEATAISEKYKVLGLPCILFLDSSGKEIPNSRITGFLEPEKFIDHLKEKSLVN